MVEGGEGGDIVGGVGYTVVGGDTVRGGDTTSGVRREEIVGWRGGESGGGEVVEICIRGSDVSSLMLSKALSPDKLSKDELLTSSGSSLTEPNLERRPTGLKVGL